MRPADGAAMKLPSSRIRTPASGPRRSSALSGAIRPASCVHHLEQSNPDSGDPSHRGAGGNGSSIKIGSQARSDERRRPPRSRTPSGRARPGSSMAVIEPVATRAPGASVPPAAATAAPGPACCPRRPPPPGRRRPSRPSCRTSTLHLGRRRSTGRARRPSSPAARSPRRRTTRRQQPSRRTGSRRSRRRRPAPACPSASSTESRSRPPASGRPELAPGAPAARRTSGVQAVRQHRRDQRAGQPEPSAGSARPAHPASRPRPRAGSGGTAHRR